MQFKFCGSFNAGDDVPPWLLDVEPVEGMAVKPTIKFLLDCHVVETTAGYQVVTDGERGGPAIIEVKGADNVVVFAPARACILPFKWMSLFPDDGNWRDDELEPTNPKLPAISCVE